MSIAAGVRFDHYEIISLLGSGGMGEVWRARDTRLDRQVALKFLPADFAESADRLRRFELEARTTSALNHPNILTIYDIGAAATEQGGAPFIVAELLDGAELRSQIEDGPLPVRQAVDYARQIADGLSAAHAKGIVHRDLKPENLFITGDGRVKILDFGLAKLKPAPRTQKVDPEASTQKPLTDPGAIMGTAGYMSPEQVRGQEADARADIFSFGIILYEMLSGKRPFNGDSAVEVMNAILKEDPDELNAANAKISPQLEKIVRRCLEKRPERRFQSASDLGFALEALSVPSNSNQTQALDTASTVTGASGKRSTGVGMRFFRSARTAWIAAGVFGIATAALAAALALPSFRQPAPDAQIVRFSVDLPKGTLMIAVSLR